MVILAKMSRSCSIGWVRFMAMAICFGLCIGLAIYYLSVVALYHKTDVSEAYRLYYLDKANHFYNRYQDLKVIKGRIYDTTWERPFFVSRNGFDYPDYNGRGMPFYGQGAMYFMLHNPAKIDSLCLHLDFIPDFAIENRKELRTNVQNGDLTLTGLNGYSKVYHYGHDLTSINLHFSEVMPYIYRQQHTGKIFTLGLDSTHKLLFQRMGFIECK